MIKLSDLPLYCQPFLTDQQRSDIDYKVKDIKDAIQYMVKQVGDVKFTNRNEKMSFESVKQQINSDFIKLVSCYILCRTELSGVSETSKEIRFFLSLYEMHLRHIDSILYEYNTSLAPHLFNMLKKLCEPYVVEMKLLIYVCKNLFKKSDYEEYNQDFGDDDGDDNGKSDVNDLLDV